MKSFQATWLPYRGVHRSAAVWGSTPSGLGHFDVALYILMGQQLERAFQERRPNSPYWVLDLGSYFGHSAFSLAYGASMVSKRISLRILSLDIFDQPQWLFTKPEVAAFVEKYGSTGPEAVARRLGDACSTLGLDKNPVLLRKRDVMELQAGELVSLAAEGFELLAIDCGKTPELMNRIAELILDERIAKPGAVLIFQDLFDWHAPWNLFAFWRLLKADAISPRFAGPNVTPFAYKRRSCDAGVICGPIGASLLPGETWCTPYTSCEEELLAFKEMSELFRRRGYADFACRAECLSVGALLRAGRLDVAETTIHELDRTWPLRVRDSALQNAYCRFLHVKTGRKDLSLVLDSAAHRKRNSPRERKQRKLRAWIAYSSPLFIPRNGHQAGSRP